MPQRDKSYDGASGLSVRAKGMTCEWPRTLALHDCFTIKLWALLRNLKITLEMIKWEHSIFALPFALCGAMLAAGGLPAWRQLGWIVVAMVSARSAAMAFNRLADASIDAANPRTATRALPVGQLTPAFVSTFVLVACGIFVLAASQLNRLTLMLSPVALAVILLYSYSKRFTRWSHLFLGFALGIAPGCRLDRGSRVARSADSAAHRRGDVLGRRIRRDLRLSGS